MSAVSAHSQAISATATQLLAIIIIIMKATRFASARIAAGFAIDL